MDVFGKSLEFDGVSSEDDNIMLCTLDTPDHNRTSAISYDILSGDITPNRPIPNLYNKKYNKVLEFKITVCKKCVIKDRFTTAEQQELIRWFTSPFDFRKFKIIDFEDSDYHTGIDYFCICNDYGETVINDSICAMFFQFQCNAPYAFLEEESTSFISSSTTPTTFTINNKSDELEDDYYPVIEVKGTSTGTVTIKNNSYPDEIMELSVKTGQTLYIDNDESDITDDKDLFDYSTDTNLCWIRLKSGNNVITVTGDCTGNIKCRYPRKVGI